MHKYILTKGSEGIFIGPISKIGETSFNNGQNIDDINSEISKFDCAVNQLKEEINDISDNEFKDVLLLILQDESYIGEIRNIIYKEKVSSTTAIKKVTEKLIVTFNAIADEYLSRRIDDIKGVSEKLISIINEENTYNRLEKESIIVKKELSVIELLSLDKDKIKGIITLNGSSNSHVAILANELGIPYLFGSEELIEELNNIENESQVLVDGYNNLVIINPNNDEINQSKLTISEEITIPQKTKVFINISSENDIKNLANINFEGIGLFRTEFIFVENENMPSEEEQFNIYKRVLEAAKGKEVTIRTMDIGADKQVKWLKSEDLISLRGIQLSLKYKEVFKTQLKALLRASKYGNLRIMFPMITSIDEVLEAKSIIYQLNKTMKCPLPKIGIMVETIEAANNAEVLAKEVDFFSIGTNDLTQNIIGLSRDSKDTDKYLSIYKDEVFKYIEFIIKAAKNADIDLSVCGQMAFEKDNVNKLIEMGINKLSVPISKLNNFKIEK